MWIDRIALGLDIHPADYITLSYGRLFEQWRMEHRSAAEELTFAAVVASTR
jgi:adenylate cyclase class 2